MSSADFIEKVRIDMTKQFPDMEVRPEHFDKFGGRSYDGLVLKSPSDPVGVALNLDQYYPLVTEEGDFDAVLKTIYEDLLKIDPDPPFVKEANLNNYEEMKAHLIMQLVPVEGNEEILFKVPHKLFGDLAVVYRFLLREGEESEASILITDAYLETCGITREELNADAGENCMRTHPFSIKTMDNVLFGDEDEINDSGIWVLSNSCNRYGASVITYPGVLEEVAETLGSSYYLLPSSTHEMLAVPDSFITDVELLDRMVRSVNTSDVSPEERLSNHCYHYSAPEKRFESGLSYESRPHDDTFRKNVFKVLD